MPADDKVVVENINTPGKTSRVDRVKYEDMRAAYLAILPSQAPGLTHDQAKEAAKQHLSPTLFPGGKTSGWWLKTVQLDLEAKGIVVREATKPLRFHQVR